MSKRGQHGDGKLSNRGKPPFRLVDGYSSQVAICHDMNLKGHVIRHPTDTRVVGLYPKSQRAQR